MNETPTNVRRQVLWLGFGVSWLLYVHRYVFALIKTDLKDEFTKFGIPEAEHNELLRARSGKSSSVKKASKKRMSKCCEQDVCRSLKIFAFLFSSPALVSKVGFCSQLRWQE